MNLFLTTAFSFFIWLIVDIAIQPPEVPSLSEKEEYQIECDYNDKTFYINTTTYNFKSVPSGHQQDLYNAVCRSLKAFRECKYLRANWPKAKAFGTQMLTKETLTLVYDSEPSGYCGYTFKELPNRVYLTEGAFSGRYCPDASRTLFHEILHHAGLPNHTSDNHDKFDPIRLTVAACFGDK